MCGFLVNPCAELTNDILNQLRIKPGSNANLFFLSVTLDVLNLTCMAKNKTVPSASEPINNCNKNGFCYIYSQCSHWDGEKEDKKEPNIIFVLPIIFDCYSSHSTANNDFI